MTNTHGENLLDSPVREGEERRAAIEAEAEADRESEPEPEQDAEQAEAEAVADGVAILRQGQALSQYVEPEAKAEWVPVPERPAMTNDPFDFWCFYGQGLVEGSGEPDEKPTSKEIIENLVHTKISEELEKKLSDMCCTVCQEGFKVGSEFCQLTCGHCFHPNCIIPWMADHSTCVNCRDELPTDDPSYNFYRAVKGQPRNLAEENEDEDDGYDFM